jgi:hypothetical protein
MQTTLEKFETLSDEQLTVLRALLDGASVTDAARVAGVSRQTASEWRNRNPSFIAVLNAGRLDVWNHVEDRLRRVTGMAVDLLEQEVAAGNVSVARDILRSAGKLNLSTVGPTSAQLVRNEIDDAEQALMFEQLMRAMADHDLRKAAAEEAEEDEPSPRLRKR